MAARLETSAPLLYQENPMYNDFFWLCVLPLIVAILLLSGCSTRAGQPHVSPDPRPYLDGEIITDPLHRQEIGGSVKVGVRIKI